jgi:hypothetical protein
MTDHPTTSRHFEDWLTAELQRTAAVADDPRPAALVTEEVLRLRRRDAAAGRYRRWTPLLGLAAVLLLPAAMLIVGSRFPSPAPEDPVVWEALLVRDSDTTAGIDVILATADGAERLIHQVSPAAVPVGNLNDVGVASTDGWLAIDANMPESWVLVDLRFPDRPMQVVRYPGTGDPRDAAWASGGRFVKCPSAQDAAGTAECEGAVWRWGPRVVAADGTRLDLDTAVIEHPDGGRITWAAGDLDIRDVALSADGSAVWLVTWDRIVGDSAITISHAETPDAITALPNATRVPISRTGVGFAGLAPDDSVLAIALSERFRLPQVVFVPTDGGPVTTHTGRLAGFVPSELAQGWHELPTVTPYEPRGDR